MTEIRCEFTVRRFTGPPQNDEILYSREMVMDGDDVPRAVQDAITVLILAHKAGVFK